MPVVSTDSTEVLLFMQSHFIAGMKISGEDNAGIIPVSSIGSGIDFDFDSAGGYIYYVEKINVSGCCPVTVCCLSLLYGVFCSQNHFLLSWRVMKVHALNTTKIMFRYFVCVK